MNLKKIIIYISLFGLGILLGGFLFSKSQPRSILNIPNCQQNCYKPNDFLGLLASVGIQKVPGLIPKVVKETEKTIVFEHPSPQAPIHYVLVPKKDIKNIAEINDSDKEYLLDIFNTAQALIREKNINTYKLISNGPGIQQVTYLHFHLLLYP